MISANLRWYQMISVDLKWSQMISYDLWWSKMISDDRRWSQIISKDLNDTTLSLMDSTSLRWFQLVSDDFSLSRLVSDGFGWSQMVSAGLSLFKFVESTAIKRASIAVRFHLVPTHASEKSFGPRLSSLLWLWWKLFLCWRDDWAVLRLLCLWLKLLFMLEKWVSSFIIALFMFKVAIYVGEMTEPFYDYFVYD